MSPIYFDNQLGATLTPLQERSSKEAYLLLYAFAGASKEHHFIATSSGAEAINHLVFSAYLDVTRKTGKNHFLSSSLSEAAAILSMSRLKELGCVFQMIPLNGTCQITPQAVAESITPRTALISLNWGCGLTGRLQSLEEIGALCKDRGILLHVDASHVLGKGDFSFEECPADVMTFNASVGGMGGLFIRENVSLSPLILGDNKQGGMRSGKLNIPALLEWAQEVKKERSYRDHYATEIARLRCFFEERLSFLNPTLRPLFTEELRLPHISCILAPGVSSSALLDALREQGLYATAGGNQMQHLSHILRACKIPTPDCYSGISFALSATTTEAEVEKAAEIVANTSLKLQSYSHYLMENAQ